MNKKPKVGILTCFIDNYGACLQAYALQKTIFALGFDNEILRYTEPVGYKNALLKNSIFGTFITYILKPSFREQYRNGFVKRPAFNKFRRTSLRISKKEYKNINYLIPQPSEYNIFLCGSDQIWNPSFYGKCNPAYYLAFVNESTKKVAYAPSIGISDIPIQYQRQFIEYVNRFNFLSVREEQGVEIIKKYTGRVAKHVLDPTLLLSVEDWKQLIKKKRRKPYLFCYLFGHSKYYERVIHKIAKKESLEVRIIPFSKELLIKDCFIEKNVGPSQFLSLINDAEIVLTDSFHCSVFSIILNKSFYVLLRNSDKEDLNMNSRIYSLLNQFDLNERLLTSTDFDNISDNSIDYEKINKILSDLRDDSLEYLKEALFN